MRKAIVALLIACTSVAGSAQLWSRQFPPTALPPLKFSLPQPSLRVLANGLKVVTLDRPQLPMVTLELAIMTGSSGDPRGLPGLAQFVASMLVEGARKQSAMQIASAIDDAGGLLDTEADWDDSYAEIEIPSASTETALRLLAGITMHPTFPADQVELMRRDTLSALEVLRQDPNYLADEVFEEATLGGTPYGHPADGVADSIRRISRSDLERFYARYYRPSNAVLLVVGDMRPERVFSWARRNFGSWKEKNHLPPSPAAAPPSLPKRQVVAVDDPHAAQSVIRIGNRVVGRSDPDYLVLSVANQILGGPAENLLFSALRSRRGLAYGASSVLDCHQEAGVWEAKTSTRPDHTVEAIQLTLDQMSQLRGRAVKRWDLQTTENYLSGHMPLRFVTNDQIANRLLDLFVYSLPLDYWSEFPEKMRSLRVSQVRAAARRYLNPRDTVIVVVGNIQSFEDSLKRFGPSRIIPVEDVDLTSETLARGTPAARGH